MIIIEPIGAVTKKKSASLLASRISPASLTSNQKKQTMVDPEADDEISPASSNNTSVPRPRRVIDDEDEEMPAVKKSDIAGVEALKPKTTTVLNTVAVAKKSVSEKPKKLLLKTKDTLGVKSTGMLCRGILQQRILHECIVWVIVLNFY